MIVLPIQNNRMCKKQRCDDVINISPIFSRTTILQCLTKTVSPYNYKLLIVRYRILIAECSVKMV